MAGCLMKSYETSVPISVDWKHWPYRNDWAKIFLPVGLNCSVSNNSDFTAIIDNNMESAIDSSHKNNNFPNTQINENVYNLLRELPTNPTTWWMGQFSKFALRLVPEMKLEIHRMKKMLNLNLSTIGWAHCYNIYISNNEPKNQSK